MWGACIYMYTYIYTRRIIRKEYHIFENIIWKCCKIDYFPLLDSNENRVNSYSSISIGFIGVCPHLFQRNVFTMMDRSLSSSRHRAVRRWSSRGPDLISCDLFPYPYRFSSISNFGWNRATKSAISCRNTSEALQRAWNECEYRVDVGLMSHREGHIDHFWNNTCTLHVNFELPKVLCVFLSINTDFQWCGILFQSSRIHGSCYGESYTTGVYGQHSSLNPTPCHGTVDR